MPARLHFRNSGSGPSASWHRLGLECEQGCASRACTALTSSPMRAARLGATACILSAGQDAEPGQGEVRTTRRRAAAAATASCDGVALGGPRLLPPLRSQGQESTLRSRVLAAVWRQTELLRMITLTRQVVEQLLAVLCQGNDAPRKRLNVDQVDGGDVLAHGRLGGLRERGEGRAGSVSNTRHRCGC